MSDDLRMSAYYYGFDSTGSRAVDRILSAVACAGKAFHSTEEWTSPCEPYHAEMTGSSCREWIQNAALVAAAELAASEAQVDALNAQRAADAVASLRQYEEGRAENDALRAKLARLLEDVPLIKARLRREVAAANALSAALRPPKRKAGKR